jgi:hypothetical protein
MDISGAQKANNNSLDQRSEPGTATIRILGKPTKIFKFEAGGDRMSSKKIAKTVSTQSSVFTCN